MNLVGIVTQFFNASITIAFDYAITYVGLKILKSNTIPAKILLFVLAIYITDLFLYTLVAYVIRTLAIGDIIALRSVMVWSQQIVTYYILARLLLKLNLRNSLLITFILFIFSLLFPLAIYQFLGI